MTQMTRMTAYLQTSVDYSHVRLSISFVISVIPVTHPFKKITNTITRSQAPALRKHVYGHFSNSFNCTQKGSR